MWLARTVIGTFDSRQKAEEAVSALRNQGFAENEVSIVARDEGGRQQQGGTGGGRSQQQMSAGRGGTQMSADGVGDGVGWGAGIGAGAGLLATAGALAVPGIGPILAAGPLAATLSGAVTGGIAGGLMDWGIPAERGRHYEGRIREGRVLCVVRSEDRKADEAADILRRHGAQDVETH